MELSRCLSVEPRQTHIWRIFVMIRYILISLSLCLLLPVGVALAQTPDSDSDKFFGQAQTIFVGSGSFLGVFTEDNDRGVTVTRVVKDSPADKAGIKKDD